MKTQSSSSKRYFIGPVVIALLAVAGAIMLAPSHEEPTVQPNDLTPGIVRFVGNDIVYGTSTLDTPKGKVVVADADKLTYLVTVQNDTGNVMGRSLNMGDFGLVPRKRHPFGTVVCRGIGKATPRPDPKSGKTEVLSVEFEPKVAGNPLSKQGKIIKRVTFEVRLTDDGKLWIGHYGFEFEDS